MTNDAGRLPPGMDHPTLGILVTDNRRRGAEVQAERTADGLVRRGWHVEFRSLASAGERTVRAVPLGPKGRNDIGRFDPSLIGPTRRFLARHAGGAVLAWGSQALRYCAVASLGRRRRPALGFVSIGSPLAWLHNATQTARYRLIASRFDFVIAVSDQTRGELVDALGLPSSKVTVIYSGVPTELFRIKGQVHDGPMRVIYVGSLSGEKDPLSAVRAFALAGREEDMSMRVLGGGPLQDSLRSATRELNIEESVTLYGSVDDVTPHLEWADVMVSTSHTEGLPGALIEAAAAGIPSVAFDVGAIDEIVDHNESGILVSDRSVPAAAEALVTLARDAELRGTLGRNARKHARQHFTIGRSVEQTDQLLRSWLK